VLSSPIRSATSETRSSQLRVVIAHDWLVRYAGSERCVEEMLIEFPGSRVITTLVDPAHVPAALGGAEHSWLQRLPGALTHHEWLVPLMPAVWRARTPLVDVEVVVSSSHACAKAVRSGPGIPHLCYCHTPMRYAWSFDEEAGRFPVLARPVARMGMSAFRRWDRGVAERVTQFVANSRAVARRISAAYGRSAVVVHPPVDTEFFHPGGERGDAFLYVGRLAGYKRPDLVVEAFRGLAQRLIVVGTGQLEHRLRANAPDNVTFLGEVDRERLRDLYRSARALVFPVNEDFGITMAEAQACGTPVIALDLGGAQDIVVHGVTGWLLDEQDVHQLRRAIRRAASEDLDSGVIGASAARFSAARFRRQLREQVNLLVEAAGRRAA
jgi:glycosyltransferase involved in cell wall biosynthesis